LRLPYLLNASERADLSRFTLHGGALRGGGHPQADTGRIGLTVSFDNSRRVAESSLRAATRQFCERFVREGTRRRVPNCTQERHGGGGRVVAGLPYEE
jgi:hypothetical protein